MSDGPDTPPAPALTSGEPVELPMDGVLDLHTFRPQDVGSVVEEYLAECVRRRVVRVRLVHGKGTGQLRRTVHALLARLPCVGGYRLASGPFGGWGATIVDLRLPAPAVPSGSGLNPGGPTGMKTNQETDQTHES